jgi:hypothetical protein
MKGEIYAVALRSIAGLNQHAGSIRLTPFMGCLRLAQGLHPRATVLILKLKPTLNATPSATLSDTLKVRRFSNLEMTRVIQTGDRYAQDKSLICWAIDRGGGSDDRYIFTG